MSTCVSIDGQTGRGKARKPADADSTRANSHEVAPYDLFDMPVLDGMTSASGRYRNDPAPEQIGSMPLSIDRADSRSPVEARGVPDELARGLDESVEDLKHDRTSDIGDFLERMQRKIDHAMAANPGPSASN